MQEVKGVKPDTRVTITNGELKLVTTPNEIVAALTEYRKPLLGETIIGDLLDSAIEGGSVYWAGVLRPLDRDPEVDFMGACIKYGFYVVDGKTGERTDVKPEDITEACRLLRDFKYIDGSPAPYFDDALNGNGDATTGDVFLQLCAFKKLVYG